MMKMNLSLYKNWGKIDIFPVLSLTYDKNILGHYTLTVGWIYWGIDISWGDI